MVLPATGTRNSSLKEFGCPVFVSLQESSISSGECEVGTECRVKMMACTKALRWDGDENIPSNEKKQTSDFCLHHICQYPISQSKSNDQAWTLMDGLRFRFLMGEAAKNLWPFVYNLYHTVDDEMWISTGFRDGRQSNHSSSA